MNADKSTKNAEDNGVSNCHLYRMCIMASFNDISEVVAIYNLVFASLHESGGAGKSHPSPTLPPSRKVALGSRNRKESSNFLQEV
jgi:hypothetical protein